MMTAKLDKMYHECREEALNELIRKARSVLSNNDDLDEFIMVMGSYFFTSKRMYDESNPMGKRGNIILDDYKPKRIENFISKWDDVLKLTGEGIRFKAKGEIVRDW